MQQQPDHSNERDAEKFIHSAQDTVEKLSRTGFELVALALSTKRAKEVKVDLTPGPRQDIKNIKALLSANPQAKPAEIQKTIRSGYFLQQQKKMGLGNPKQAAARLDQYEKTIYRKASLELARENLEKIYGLSVIQSYKEQQGPKHGQAQRQQHKQGPSY